MSVEDLLREARSTFRRLEPEEALAATRQGGLIVDIRSEVHRAEQGLVPGAYFVARNVLEWRADAASDHALPDEIAGAGTALEGWLATRFATSGATGERSPCKGASSYGSLTSPPLFSPTPRLPSSRDTAESEAGG